MKKISLATSLFVLLVCFAQAQSKSKSNDQCGIFKQIADLVSDDKLKTIEGTEFKPKYFIVQSWNKVYSTTLKIAGAQEIVIFQESNKNRYSCILKDYGADEAKAKEDLKIIVKTYSNCLNVQDVKITKAPYSLDKDDSFANFYYNHCRIQISTYKTSITDSWVTVITLQNTAHLE